MKKKTKAVGLFSGGMDSTLAAKLVNDLGVEVQAITFVLPWKQGKLPRIQDLASQLGIPLKVEYLKEDYLDILRHPQFGRGTAINPCVDCHLFMIRKAAGYMTEIGADFVFTGEVLGQRPMSQLKGSLHLIDERSGLQGRLLRPMCAQLLEPTVPEQEGWIDRSKLLALQGRSRKEQFRLARESGLKGFSNPAGGCILTDRNFGRRLEDVFQYGYHSWDALVTLEWGRHFRLNPSFKAVAGRDDNENKKLTARTHPDDFIFELKVRPGPTVVLQGTAGGTAPTDDIMATAAGLVRYFSRFRGDPSDPVMCWKTGHPDLIKEVPARALSDHDVDGIKI